MKKILVTGASGLIGQKVCSGLLKKEHQVVATDTAPEEYNAGKENYSFVQADASDRETFDRLFKEEKFYAVVHCACTVDNDFGHIITEKEMQRSEMFDSFIYTSALVSGAKKFILVSTSQMYDFPNNREPIRETHRVKLVTNYSSMKKMSENKLSDAILNNHEMISAVMRVAPVYTLSYIDNLLNRIVDPSNGSLFVYNNGDYGFQFCCLHNMVDFVLSFIITEDEKKYTGIYNVSDTNIISAREIIAFVRKIKTFGPVLQKKYSSDVIKSKFNKLKNREEIKTNYRYNDPETFFHNNILDNTKASKVCTFKWNIDNTK